MPLNHQEVIAILEELLNLAQTAKSICRPNPAVGAIIIKNGKIIGKGYTQPVGGHHAEVMAIKSSLPENLVGSELFVSLAPCTFQGQTPPCTQAIKQSKIKKVTYLLNDPNPKMTQVSQSRQSVSLKKVLQEGLGDIEVNDLSILLEKYNKHKKKILAIAWKLFLLNFDFYKSIIKDEPTITIKYAMSLDGKTANHHDQSKWITHSTTRQHVHLERSRHDAIMVGAYTFLKDNPQLNVRLPSSNQESPRQPLPIVVIGSDFQAPVDLELANYHLFHRETLFLINEDSPMLKKVRASLSVKVMTFSNQLGLRWYDKEFLIRMAKKFQIQSIYAEGGAMLHHYLITSGLVDQLAVYVSPKVFLGPSGHHPFDNNQNTNNDLPQHFPPFPLWQVQVNRFENDVEWTGIYEKEVAIKLWKNVVPDVELID